jgi:DNA ligase-1
LKRYPLFFSAFDIIEYEATDIRNTAYTERKKLLKKIVGMSFKRLKIGESIKINSWEDLAKLREESRDRNVEGFILKNKDSEYLTGRRRGGWWKWKVDPYTIDAVMIYAQRGHGRRASLYTDYTFGVWNEDKLISFAKAYSGLTDEEIRKVDDFVRKNTLEKFGPVRTVKPELVFELSFEGIQLSSRHKSGIAVRFPRITKWRTDKKPSGCRFFR